ncbi:hypothetical protein [Halobacteriovorax sp.]|uniref:hypothetical protein n=1 Tax=Halobacteriovorax sp. TaxID=2020862 RepID=UPI0035658CF2
MNKSLLLLMFTFSLHSTARVISPGQVIGFSDSSFNYQSQEEANQAKFCFWGEFESTCEEIKSAAFKMNGAYYQGNHDKIKLVSCELIHESYQNTEDTVKVSYELSDDYGSEFSVTRYIESCAVSSSL